MGNMQVIPLQNADIVLYQVTPAHEAGAILNQTGHALGTG